MLARRSVREKTPETMLRGFFDANYSWRECEGVEPTYPARHEAQRI